MTVLCPARTKRKQHPTTFPSSSCAFFHYINFTTFTTTFISTYKGTSVRGKIIIITVITIINCYHRYKKLIKNHLQVICELLWNFNLFVFYNRMIFYFVAHQMKLNVLFIFYYLLILHRNTKSRLALKPVQSMHLSAWTIVSGAKNLEF